MTETDLVRQAFERHNASGFGAAAGMASFEDWGHYRVHWRRETDGQWRVAADAPVSKLPQQAAPGAR